jgi:predicted peroxiredoxin/TusA-related sulfurtransferase
MVEATVAEPSAPVAPRLSIDTRGRSITTAVIYEAVLAMRLLAEGESVEVLTDDSEAIDNDVRAWCRTAGHQLLRTAVEPGAARYQIAKGAPPETHHSLAVIITDPGLLELLSPLGFALGAALGGSKVHIYFQGPGVRVLKKDYKPRLGGLSRPFSRFARRGLERVGHYPAAEKLRQLQDLGAQLYVCGPSMERFGVPKDQLAFDGVTVAAYLTFVEVMNSSDVQIALM